MPAPYWLHGQIVFHPDRAQSKDSFNKRLWNYKVGQEEHRAWKTCVDMDSLPLEEAWTIGNPLKRLSPGDRVCVYQKNTGYVGNGVVMHRPSPKDFAAKFTPA